MAIDLTAALARLLSDPSMRTRFARDPAGVARALDVAGPHRATFRSLRPEQIEAQARVLVGKRFHEVASLLPRTVQRTGDETKDLFLAFATTFWPAGHRRHVADAVAFGRFLSRRNPAYVDVAELNRLRFLMRAARVRLHVGGVRVPGSRPRRAVQLLYRRSSGDVCSWLIHLRP